MSRKITGLSPSIQLPAGSIDSHMHVYDEQLASQPGGPPLPSDFADVAMYRELQQWLGLERVVVVQANAYQSDNRCILAALKEFGGIARGVAVVKPDAEESLLEDLHRQGVRGARVMELGGPVGVADLLAVNARVAPLGWHCIVQFDGRQMVERQPVLEQIDNDYIIDHTGKYLTPVSCNDPAFKALLELIDKGNCYIKLAGCYETSLDGAPDYQDLAAMSRALIAHAPERVIWGSNWPHVSLPPEKSPDDGALLDRVCSWIPDAKTLQQIFVDNPERLYGFDA